MAFRQYVRPGHTRLVINCYVTPHFKGGRRQGPQEPPAATFQYNPPAGV